MSDVPRGKRKAAELPAGAYSDAKARKSETAVVELMLRGYMSFKARILEHTDGAQVCQASLYYNVPDGPAIPMAQVTSGTGHSEVSAVDHFVHATCHFDVALYSAYQKEVDKDPAKGIKIRCEQKAVCVRCAVFLGLLGIQPFSAATTKAKWGKTMDLTQWGMKPMLRVFMARYVGTTPNIIDDLVTFKFN